MKNIYINYIFLLNFKINTSLQTFRKSNKSKNKYYIYNNRTHPLTFYRNNKRFNTYLVFFHPDANHEKTFDLSEVNKIFTNDARKITLINKILKK